MTVFLKREKRTGGYLPQISRIIPDIDFSVKRDGEKKVRQEFCLENGIGRILPNKVWIWVLCPVTLEGSGKFSFRFVPPCFFSEIDYN